MLLLDNTNSENKCNEMIFFVAWLVANDVFEEGAFFCMMVGHTYTELDRSFNTMISRLMQYAIYTLTSLMEHIWRALQQYECLQVVQLHALWDWKNYFEPHVVQRLKGFCTSQYGTGMHEFVLRKDGEGIVRLWCRKSSQASSVLPEGPGYQVFETVPSGTPDNMSLLSAFFVVVCSVHSHPQVNHDLHHIRSNSMSGSEAALRAPFDCGSSSWLWIALNTWQAFVMSGRAHLQTYRVMMTRTHYAKS